MESPASYNPSEDANFQRELASFLLPTQQFFVFQLAAKNTSIKSDDGRPWIRGVGFAANLDAARSVARYAFESDKTETRIMPVGKVFLAGKEKYEGLDLPLREKEQRKANRLIDAWEDSRRRTVEEVQAMAKAKALVPPPESDVIVSEQPVSPQKETQTAFPTISLYDKPPFDLPVLQVTYAIAIVPDTEDLQDPEPALVPLFAYESMEALQGAVSQARKSKDLIHLDIFCGTLGNWLPLTQPLAEQVFHHDPLRQQLQKNLTPAWRAADA